MAERRVWPNVAGPEDEGGASGPCGASSPGVESCPSILLHSERRCALLEDVACVLTSHVRGHPGPGKGPV